MQMVQAIREIVTVGSDNSIFVRAPELIPGATAEVIVLVDSENANSIGNARLAALKALQESVGLTAEQAEAWVKDADLERKASSRM